jgi:hypothetical protein
VRDGEAMPADPRRRLQELYQRDQKLMDAVLGADELIAALEDDADGWLHDEGEG